MPLSLSIGVSFADTIQLTLYKCRIKCSKFVRSAWLGGLVRVQSPRIDKQDLRDQGFADVVFKAKSCSDSRQVRNPKSYL